MGEQPVLIGGQAEEIALLLHPIDRRALRADAHAVFLHLSLGFGVVGLVAHRVPAGVAVLVDVAIGLHPPPDLFRRAVVARLAGADEIVVGTAERGDHLLEQRGVAVGQRLRLQALARRRLLHLDAVLVGTGQEIDVVAVEPHEAGDRIGRQRLIGMADMGGAVGIGNRGRDVELWRLHRRLALLDVARENRKCRPHYNVRGREGASHSGRAGEAHQDRQDGSLAVEIVFVGQSRRSAQVFPHLGPPFKRRRGRGGTEGNAGFGFVFAPHPAVQPAARRSRKPSQPSSLPRPVTLSA